MSLPERFVGDPASLAGDNILDLVRRPKQSGSRTGSREKRVKFQRDPGVWDPLVVRERPLTPGGGD